VSLDLALINRIKDSVKQPITATYLSLGVLLIVVWIVRVPTLSQPLLENHSFRQTQTAYQSLTLSQNFGSLLHPKLPIMGSPWEVPFEFPLFQFSAALLIRFFSLEADYANRLASLIWFSLCLTPLWFFIRRFISILASLATVTIFSFSAFSLQWSRGSLIEYCAVFFGITFALFLHKLWDKHSLLSFLGATLAGATCAAVKSTTFFTFLLLALISLPNIAKRLLLIRENVSRILLISTSCLVAMFVGFVWTRHADHIKAANPATRWLESSQLNEWSFGTLQQRRTYSNWEVILGRIDSLIIPKFSLVLLVVVPLVFRLVRHISLASLAVMFISILTFFNLYVIHDYYLVAISIPAAILVGCLFEGILSQYQGKAQFLTFSLTLALSVVWLLLPTKWYWMMPRNDIPKFVTELSSLTKEDQYVFVGGRDWDPTLLYYAKRQGLMLAQRGASLDDIKRMTDLNKYDFYNGPSDRMDIISLRGFYSPVGMETFRIDDSLEDMEQALVFESSSKSVAEFDQEVFTLKCDESSQFDTTSESMFDQIFETTSRGSNYIIIGDSLAPTPVADYLHVRYGPSNKYPMIRCSGDGVIEIVKAL
jgi:hypothetical protein